MPHYQNPLYAYIGAMFRDGLSHAQIAVLLGVTRARVAQLLHAEGLSKDVRGMNTAEYWRDHLQRIKDRK